MEGTRHLWKLEWGEIHVVPWQGRRLLTIRFKDRQGNVHSWAPRWDDLFSVFINLSVLEKDAPSKKWLETVADTATTILEICAERLTPLLGSTEGARLLVTGSQERLRRELRAAWEEQLRLDELSTKVGKERLVAQLNEILNEVGDELLLKPNGWLTKELLRRLEQLDESSQGE